jgi:hypothetical protein
MEVLMAEIIITKEYLDKNPQYIFVFGDNLKRIGKKGAAMLRDHPRSYGFITKKAPSYNDSAYYRKEEYEKVLTIETKKLLWEADKYPDKIFLISKLGSGLANKYNIWDLIRPKMEELERTFSRFRCLWTDNIISLEEIGMFNPNRRF